MALVYVNAASFLGGADSRVSAFDSSLETQGQIIDGTEGKSKIKGQIKSAELIFFFVRFFVLFALLFSTFSRPLLSAPGSPRLVRLRNGLGSGRGQEPG